LADEPPSGSVEPAAELVERHPLAPILTPAPVAPVPHPSQLPGVTPSVATPAVVTEPSPARPLAPIAPRPGLEVWATPKEPGPFSTPYQPPDPSASPIVTSMGPQRALPIGADQPIDTPQAAASLADASVQTKGRSHAQVPPPVMAPPPPVMAPPPPVMAPPPTSAPAPTVVVAAARSAAPPPPPRPVAARQPATTRACPNCSLPLSTRARFCRRCGAPQPP
jgi:hypothetical protein